MLDVRTGSEDDARHAASAQPDAHGLHPFYTVRGAIGVVTSSRQRAVHELLTRVHDEQLVHGPGVLPLDEIRCGARVGFHAFIGWDSIGLSYDVRISNGFVYIIQEAGGCDLYRLIGEVARDSPLSHLTLTPT